MSLCLWTFFFPLATMPRPISTQSAPIHPSRLSFLLFWYSLTKLVRLCVPIALCSGLYYKYLTYWIVIINFICLCLCFEIAVSSSLPSHIKANNNQCHCFGATLRDPGISNLFPFCLPLLAFVTFSCCQCTCSRCWLIVGGVFKASWN
jgi:hypothetical protein